jgi:hypothetical protein
MGFFSDQGRCGVKTRRVVGKCSSSEERSIFFRIAFNVLAVYIKNHDKHVLNFVFPFLLGLKRKWQRGFVFEPANARDLLCLGKYKSELPLKRGFT